MLQHSYLRVPIYHERLAPVFQTDIQAYSYSAGHLPATLYPYNRLARPCD